MALSTLQRVKTILGITDTLQDAILTVLVEDTEQEFADYCNRIDIPDTACNVLAQMTVYRYNRLNAEGIASQGYSGVSQSYEADYSRSIISQLNKYRKLQVL
jgi:hypothetical protein